MSDSSPEPIGLRLGVSNDAYHADTTAVSKSQLDLIARSPSLLEWSRNAPVDEEAEKAVDLGNAFEALLLEPERFAREYIQGPKDAPRNTKDGKAAWAEVEERAKANKATIMPHDQWRQVHLMRDSTLAHPVARRALEAEAIVQGSYWWIDDHTGVRCRCRPDWMHAHSPFVIDLKTAADMRTFHRSMVEFRWFVQQSFYSDGLEHYYGEQPTFAFLVVFTSRSAGRYPVHIFEFDADAKAAGRAEYRADLERYAECIKTDDWIDVEGLSLPRWYWARSE